MDIERSRNGYRRIKAAVFVLIAAAALGWWLMGRRGRSSVTPNPAPARPDQVTPTDRDAATTIEPPHRDPDVVEAAEEAAERSSWTYPWPPEEPSEDR